MMKVNDFIEKLKLANSLPSKYVKGGWGKWDGSKWSWDCVCLVKAILWGWNNDTSKPRGGGAVYGSNGVPDLGTEQIIKVCNNVSTDFSNLQVGELVHMNGHVGVYVGDDTVIEATVAFGGGCVKSKINSKGQRLYYNTGKYAGPTWTNHGFLPYVDYSSTPQPEPQPEPTPVTPEYTTGTYQTVANVAVRTGAGTNYPRKKVKDLTADGKKHATSKLSFMDAYYKKGTNFTALEIIKNSDTEYWAKSPSGYICIVKGDSTCCKKIS